MPASFDGRGIEGRDWSVMSLLVWLAVALIALIGEAFTTALVLASFAVAAIITALLSLVVEPPIQVFAFAALSLVLLLGVRPVAMRLMPSNSDSDPSRQIGPVGRHGVVTDRIDATGGQIRIGSGEFWSARVDSGGPVTSGREVEVVRLDGLTAVVRPVRSAPAIEENDSSPAPDDPFGLSARELEVLQLVAEGRTNAEIADSLVISLRTVHHHVSHILDKLDASTRTEAVRIAAEHGLIRGMRA
jgi:membrane protein implicated in regulation of membrane protease activity/DNA-binding CsgD family transcriptional regulator